MFPEILFRCSSAFFAEIKLAFNLLVSLFLNAVYDLWNDQCPFIDFERPALVAGRIFMAFFQPCSIMCFEAIFTSG